ncbi:rRNA maturation RNase YbeY [Candidatus Parcubacteria bacterium]|nr:MAG: rRNA maturation RNase YbeY [Candidatus Parcubacteria bacterium]
MEVFVPIFVESRYKVNRKKIKSSVKSILEEKNIVGPVEVSVAIVGDRKMKDLNKKYRNLDKTTNVLSFPQMEGEVSVLPKDILFLGDVVISYPQVIKEASEEEVLVDEKICELVEHGLMHLLGIHHD